MDTRAVLLALCMVVPAVSFFSANHACGDPESRQHMLRSCRRSLMHLDDSVPPSLDDASDHHNFKHFHNAQKGSRHTTAKKRAEQCMLCVLHGFEDCDLPEHEYSMVKIDDETVVEELGLEVEAAEDMQTAFSQNCLDHIEDRKAERQPGSSPWYHISEVRVEGTHSLKGQLEHPQWVDPSLYEHPISLAEDTTEAAATDAAATTAADVPTDEENAAVADTQPDAPLGNLEAGLEAAAAKLLDLTKGAVLENADVAESSTREVSEGERPYYLCGIIDQDKEADLEAPEGYKIDEIKYASFGTPRRLKGASTVDDKKAIEAQVEAKEAVTTPLNLAETTAATTVAEDIVKTLPGIQLFKGDSCYDMDFSTRKECSAYNSMDIVQGTCKDSNRCTLRATGDSKVFPFHFQKLTCDKKLKLFVKVTCTPTARKSANTGALASTAAANQIADAEDFAVSYQRHETAVLDFNSDEMDYTPGIPPATINLAEAAQDGPLPYDAETGEWTRPAVREQIEPPADFKIVGVFNGRGQLTFRCENSGNTDNDGPIYIWRPNADDLAQSYVSLFNKTDEGTTVRVAHWDLLDNTYKGVTDGDSSFAVADATPVGTVSDDLTDGAQVQKLNAQDLLLRTSVTGGDGVFTDVEYLQRYDTMGGVPPNTNGRWTDPAGIVRMRCTSAMAAAAAPVTTEMTGTYVLYSQKAHLPATGPGSNIPVWVWVVMALGILLTIALVATVVYWKVKGAPRFINRKRARKGFSDTELQTFQSTLLYDDYEQADEEGQAAPSDNHLAAPGSPAGSPHGSRAGSPSPAGSRASSARSG